MATTDQGAYAAVCRPRSICSCMQTKEHMQLYTDQGAYAAVCRPRSICSCIQTKEPMRLYADQGAYAAVCRPCKEHMHMIITDNIMHMATKMSALSNKEFQNPPKLKNKFHQTKKLSRGIVFFSLVTIHLAFHLGATCRQNAKLDILCPLNFSTH